MAEEKDTLPQEGINNQGSNPQDSQKTAIPGFVEISRQAERLIALLGEKFTSLLPYQQTEVRKTLTDQLLLQPNNPELALDAGTHKVELITQAAAAADQAQKEEELKKAKQAEEREDRDLWEVEKAQQQALQPMEKSLGLLQVEWNIVLGDEEKLNARMRKKAPLDEALLMVMPEAELRQLEVTERAELALLRAVLEQEEEIYKKKKGVVVDTGRKIGIKGEDDHVLGVMEEAADGKRQDVMLTPPQAKMVRDVRDQRFHIMEQRRVVETQEERVEKILTAEDKRGIAYATVEEVKAEVRNIGVQEAVSNPTQVAALAAAERDAQQVALRKAEKVQERQEDAAVKTEKAKVETGEIEATEKRLLQMSQKMAEILKIEAPTDIRSSGDYIPAFTKALNGQELSEAQHKRLSGLVEQLRNHEKDKVIDNIAKETRGQFAISGMAVATKSQEPVGKFTQQLSQRSAPNNGQEKGNLPKGNSWER